MLVAVRTPTYLYSCTKVRGRVGRQGNMQHADSLTHVSKCRKARTSVFEGNLVKRTVPTPFPLLLVLC